MKYRISKIKNIILSAMILFCIIFCFASGVPAMPSSKSLDIDVTNAAEIKYIILDNMFDVFYFCFSVIFGAVVLYFGIALRKKAAKPLSRAGILLSLFILSFLS